MTEDTRILGSSVLTEASSGPQVGFYVLLEKVQAGWLNTMIRPTGWTRLSPAVLGTDYGKTEKVLLAVRFCLECLPLAVF